MFFTQDDYKKIQQWLIKNSVKDTEFNEANIPFNGEETITIVQGNQNKKVFLKDLIAQVFNLGISDFVNITDKYDAPNISLEEAIRLIPSRARKEGQVITFLDREDHWHIYQFKGVLNQWNVLDTWEDLFDWEKLIINSILPDEEDLTKSPADENGNSYLSLKDREYNPEDFSGLGRVIIRKNIVEVEDPIYGKVKKNLLYQDMFTQSNTIYEIRYDFDLGGKEITIPEGCVLDFQGGSFSNGSLTGNYTKIKAEKYKIFSKLTRKGRFVVDVIYPQWFGAIGDGIIDDTQSIQDAVDFAAHFIGGFYGEITGVSVKIPAGVYYISSTINIKSNAGINVIGDGHTKSVLWNKSKTDIFSLSGNNFRGKFDGLRFTTNQGSFEGAAISIVGSGNQIYVTNCWMNNLKYGIYCNPSSDSNFHNNIFEYVRTPVYIGGIGSGYFDIAFNIFYNVGPISLGDKIFDATFDFDGVKSLTFHHNRITNDSITSAQSSLIRINNCSNIQIENNIFNGSSFRASSIRIVSSNNITVKGNTFPKNYNGRQCYIYECKYIYLIENTFPTSISGDYNGIECTDSDYIFIDKNIINKQSLYSMIVNSKNKMNFISITNNYFEGGTIVAIYPTIELHNIKHLIFNNNIISSKNINENDLLLDTTNRAIMSLNIFAGNVYIDAGTQVIVNGNYGNIKYNIIESNKVISENSSSQNNYFSGNTNTTPIIFKRDDGTGKFTNINSDGTLSNKVKFC